jgi:hypothetical protein
MKTRAVWNVSVTANTPERMATAKAVLHFNSYNEVLDYFLRAFEKQFADEIAEYKIKNPELVVEPPPKAEPLF